MLHLISWNVNGIRSIAGKGFYAWLKESDADIVCIQETKAQQDQLDDSVFKPEGYHDYWASAQKKGYSGVAVYSKLKADKMELMGLDDFDNEGRVLRLEFGQLVLFNCYFPNSQDAGARLAYKLAFCKALKLICDGLVAQGKHVVICGDYNIAHKAIDLENPAANVGNPGFLPEERAWMDEFLTQGYVDCFRMFNKSAKQYSWWSYRTRARERNVGWRIDYFCCDTASAGLIKNAAIMPEQMGSDHCPVSIILELP